MSRLDTFVAWWVGKQRPAKVSSKHIVYTQEAIMQVWDVLEGIDSVLDIGCAGGEALGIFKKLGVKRCVGVTNQKSEYEAVKNKGFQCVLKDMHYLNTNDGQFDLVFSRRTVEHSPVPFYLLSEFVRISRKWVYIITPRYPCRMWTDFHCAVLPPKVWEEWGKRLGLKLVGKKAVEIEPNHQEVRMLFEVMK